MLREMFDFSIMSYKSDIIPSIEIRHGQRNLIKFFIGINISISPLARAYLLIADKSAPFLSVWIVIDTHRDLTLCLCVRMCVYMHIYFVALRDEELEHGETNEML